MEMPKPTEAHKKLEKLVGTWAGEETMHPSPWLPEGGTAESRSTNRVALGGFVVLGDYEQETKGQTTFTGHAVYTYDQQAKCYILYWFDCLGGQVNAFKGNFEGDLLTLISDESGEAGPRFARLTYDLSKIGKLASRMEMSQDGKNWNVFMDAAYTRKG